MLSNTNILLGVLLVGCIVLLLCYTSDSPLGNKKVCNSFDQKCFKIVEKFDPSTHDEASKRLSYLNTFSVKLMRHLRKKYLWREVTSDNELYRKELALFLISNYNPDNIVENNPKDSKNTSFVEDKGKIFALCLREKASGKNKFHSNAILEYVVLHELSHMATTEFGHSKPFWYNFKILMEEAKECGIHKPFNYGNNPEVYCSLKIEYNPYFDDSLST